MRKNKRMITIEPAQLWEEKQKQFGTVQRYRVQIITPHLVFVVNENELTNPFAMAVQVTAFRRWEFIKFCRLVRE